MSIPVLVLGNSGSGKSTSLRNLDPRKTLLIQCINKPLPFKSTDWKVIKAQGDGGNVFRTDSAEAIVKAMRKSPHEIVVVDDYQAVMVNELMSRSSEKGFAKFESLGKHAWDVFTTAGDLADNRRVYVLAHTQTDEFGNVKMKTVGKMVDQTIVPEGYFTVVLRTDVQNGNYHFRTQTNGQDCCKSPMGMFADVEIPNDLAQVDEAVCEYWGIGGESN